MNPSGLNPKSFEAKYIPKW